MRGVMCYDDRKHHATRKGRSAMSTVIYARNYETWMFERFDLAELRVGAVVLVGFEDEYYQWIRFTKAETVVWVPGVGDLGDDEDTFSDEMNDAELNLGITKVNHEVEVETVIAPHGLVGGRVDS